MTALLTFLKSIAKAIMSGLAALIGTIVLALDLQPADHQGIQFLTQSQWGIIILAVLASFGITWRVPNGNGGLPGEVETTTNPNSTTTPVIPPAVNTGAPATQFPAAAVAASQPVQQAAQVQSAPPANVLEPVQYLGGQQ